MNGLRHVHADPLDPGAGLASWYVPGRADGFGDRLLMFDNAGTPSLELLRFRERLAATPGFEDVLRDRVRLLDKFRHPSFAPVRSVQHLEGEEGLTLVSVHAAGQRLSELFDQRPRRGLSPGIVTWLLRELTPAIAALQSHSGVAHGALTADRIVLTPDGRLCIVEHVLGSALQQLHLDSAALWREFGIVAAGPGPGPASLDAQGDVIQLAGVALSMLLGRSVTLHDLQHSLPGLLDELPASGATHHRAPLRQWLERALQLEAPVYRSAADAHADLKELPAHEGTTVAVASAVPLLTGSSQPFEHSWSAEMDHAPKRPQIRPVPPPDDSEEVPPFSDGVDIADSFPSEIVAADAPAPPRREMRGTDPPDPPVITADPPRTIVSREQILRDRITREAKREPAFEAPLMPPPRPAPPAAPKQRRPWPALPALPALPVITQPIGLALAAIVLAQFAVIAVLLTRTPAATAQPAVVIDSPQPGDTVMVNGAAVGATPFRLALGADTKSVTVVSNAAAAERGQATSGRVDAVKPTEVSARGTSVAIPESPASKQGGLRLVSPIELTVLEGERVLGSTSDPIFASAGSHQVEVVNTALGFRNRQTLTFKGGQILTQRITVPAMPVSVNAQPWAQVFVDGNAIGETPLAKVPVTIGEHEFVFRHPQLGERRQKIVVRADEVTRVTANFAR